MENVVETHPCWKKKRYYIVFLTFCCFFNACALHQISRNSSFITMYENWGIDKTNTISESFDYSNILIQVIGGWLAARIGGNIVFGFGIAASAILNILAPIAIKTSFEMTLAVRIIDGVFGGVLFPSIYAVWAQWAPPHQRTLMFTIGFAGTYAGHCVSTLALPYIDYWEIMHYIFGAFGIVLSIIWILFVGASPKVDSQCSKEEIEFIQSKLGKIKNEQITWPWKEMFTSKAVYAIIICHICENWAFMSSLIKYPFILKNNYYPSQKLIALPNLVIGIVLPISGFIADFIQVKNIVTTTQVRKYFTCIPFFAQTIFLLIASFTTNKLLSFVCTLCSIGFGAITWSGFIVNSLDIAPQQASVIMGISNTFAILNQKISEGVVHVIAGNNLEEWRIAFKISCSIYCIGCIIYWFWSSGELQDWAKTPENTT